MMLKLSRRQLRSQAGITLMELLVSMAILSVITTMILVSWFALQDSYGYSVHSSHAREAARDAVARMTVTIRDVQRPPGVTNGMAIFYAEASEINFYTSYQQSGNANAGSPPVAACFLFVPPSGGSTGKIYYFIDENGNGFTDEKANGEGKVVVDNVMNATLPSTTDPTDLFTYTYFGDDGTLSRESSVTAEDDLRAIYSVQIHVLVDLNPQHSPVYMDLQTTAQPRNLRPQT